MNLQRRQISGILNPQKKSEHLALPHEHKVKELVIKRSGSRKQSDNNSQEKYQKKVKTEKDEKEEGEEEGELYSD